MENIVLISIPETTIRNIVEQAVENAMAKYKALPEQPANKIVDLNGLLKARPFIGSRSTIYKKISKGIIPHSKRGKKVYFDLEEVDAWLISNKKKTVSDLLQEMETHLQSKRK